MKKLILLLLLCSCTYFQPIEKQPEVCIISQTEITVMFCIEGYKFALVALEDETLMYLGIAGKCKCEEIENEY